MKSFYLQHIQGVWIVVDASTKEHLFKHESKEVVEAWIDMYMD